MPWFLNLGKPHPRDPEAVRIHGWEEWPGPERGFGDWFGRYPAVVREHLEAAHPGRRTDLDVLWQRIERSVIESAAPNVPEAGEGDAWHGPSACVGDAGYTAALLGCHLFLNRPVPDPIVERWAWFLAGHWPCDYAEEPPGYWDESLVYVPASKLLVY